MNFLFFLYLLLVAATSIAIPLQSEPRCVLRSNSELDRLPLIFSSKGAVALTEGAGDWSFEIPSGFQSAFTVYCAGANNTISKFQRKSIGAWCDLDGNVESEYGQVTLDDLLCSTLVIESITRNGTCYNNYAKIHIRLDSEPFIEVCHDESRSETLYSLHTLNGPDLDKSESASRPSFKEGGFYPDIDANKCYTQVEQLDTAARILGSTAQASKYINPNTQYFLSRGHLTANADGIYAYEKIATFYFVNVVPQWQIINAGNWERLESALRNYAESNQAFIKIYTGASGVTTLKDVNNNDKPIYLGKDSSGNLKNVLPVPKLMYKVIVNEAARTGAVVVTINNPYPENHNESDILCQSVCNQLSWITFNTTDVRRGYTYCCDISTFHSALPVFPNPGNLALMR